MVVPALPREVVHNLLKLLEHQDEHVMGALISKAALVERGWRAAVRLIPRRLLLRREQGVILKSQMMVKGGIFMLRGKDLGVAGAKTLAGSLSGAGASIVAINLRANIIRAEGATALAGVLAQCTGLTYSL